MWEYFVPGGTMGVGLKSNCPSICAYTDNLEFVLDVINKLIFISACFYHQIPGIYWNFLSTDANPAT